MDTDEPLAGSDGQLGQHGHHVMTDGWCTVCETNHPDAPAEARHPYLTDHLASFEAAVTHVLDRMGSDGTTDLRAAIIGAARSLDEEPTFVTAAESGQQGREAVVHVVPRADLVEHTIGQSCVCGPDHDERAGGAIVVHHSLDNRESTE